MSNKKKKVDSKKKISDTKKVDKATNYTLPPLSSIGKPFFDENSIGLTLSKVGLVSQNDDWANFRIAELIETHFTDDPVILSEPDILARLEYNPDCEFPPNFDPSNNYFLLIAMEDERTAFNIAKYFSHFLGVANEYYTNESSKELSILLCIIYGIDIDPSEEDGAALNISRKLANVRILHLSQMDTDALLKSAKEQLSKGQLPTNLDLLRLVYLPELNQRRRNAQKTNDKED
jgi:hypothetical protein